jgi:hypothetical protein
MLISCFRRRRAAAGAWLVVCLAAFAHPPPARAAAAHYDGWFLNRIDQSGLDVPCGEGLACDLGVHLYPTEANPAPFSIEDWELDRLFQASLRVASTSVTADDAPETWACVLPPPGIPTVGQSAGPVGLEGQRLNPDIVVLRGRLHYDPDDWPAHCGMCLMIAVGFGAIAGCFQLVRRASAPPLSGDPYVQGDDSPRHVLIADLAEPRPAHIVCQLISLRKPAYRFGQVSVRIAAAGERAPNPRQHAPRVEVI